MASFGRWLVESRWGFLVVFVFVPVSHVRRQGADLPREAVMATCTEPSPIDLVRELREALGMFAGAMPITPKAAWEEALERARGLQAGRCGACMAKDSTPWGGQ